MPLPAAPEPPAEPLPEPAPELNETVPWVPPPKAPARAPVEPAFPETRQVARPARDLVPQRGRSLRLQARQAGRRSLYVAWDHQFRIGRSSQKSDAVIVIEPATPERQEREASLSRVHAQAVVLGGIPMLRDGDGKGESANGSSYRGVPLSPQAAVPIEQGGPLELHGAEVSIDVKPLLAEVPLPGGGGPEVSPWLPGGIFFRPGDPEVPNDALWLFSAAGLAFGSHRWIGAESKDGATPPLVLHRWKDGFVLLNQAAEETVMLNDQTIPIGGRAVFVTGQQFRLGPVIWDVLVTAH
jgi:hypothetical protein